MEDRFRQRFWNEKMKIMLYPSMVSNLPDDGSGEFIAHSLEANSIRMQCTGLKDKNGKLIYEGDILDYDHGIGEVVWNFYAFNIMGYYCSYENYPTLAFNECPNPQIPYEIIGNIYENPELLNEDEK